jgi:hypothetical protein
MAQLANPGRVNAAAAAAGRYARQLRPPLKTFATESFLGQIHAQGGDDLVKACRDVVPGILEGTRA